MIQVKGVSKTVHSAAGKVVPILQDVSFHIRDGEFVGLAGRNGSGKTTLARMLNGLQQPTCGIVLVDGYDTSNHSTLIEVRRRTGMVCQHPDNQIVSSIVEEDIAFGPENLGLSQDEVKERIEWALQVTGLLKLRHHNPSLLSGGQKQRVAIAGALAMRPSHLILDEPTSMLDLWGRDELMKTLHKVNRELGVTVLLISHLAEDLLCTDRLLVLDRGRIAIDEKPEVVFAQEEASLEEWGIAIPDIPFLMRELATSGVQSDASVIQVEGMVEWICRLLNFSK
jgi:energy-coupling factor transport system ATP-binding protein